MTEQIERRRQTLLQAHQTAFGSRTSDVRFAVVPYRICPLGAHVDHQLGLVTGLTIDSGIMLAFTPASGGRMRLTSLNFPGPKEFHFDSIPPASSGDWGNYARGAALALLSTYAIQMGIDGVIEGNLPAGGISSSAAAGIAYLIALEAVNGLRVPHGDNIRLDQAIENNYIGLNNGILDQSVILLGEEGRLLRLDCQSGDHESVSFPASGSPFEVTIVYSGIGRSLASTDYNQRVSECQEAARLLLQYAGNPRPEHPVLRHVSKDIFDTYAHLLPEAPRKRAQHFFDENARVPRGVDAWREGDLARFGDLVNASGESSIRNYESGAPHLITLYRLLSNMPGVYGARFSGAGFRGSAAALTHPDAREEIRQRIQTEYSSAHPDTADKFSIHFCQLGSGASLQ
jgi:galactokinase